MSYYITIYDINLNIIAIYDDLIYTNIEINHFAFNDDLYYINGLYRNI